MARTYDGLTTCGTNTVRPVPKMGWGTCRLCGRERQALANDVCEDCRFYATPETEVERAEILKRGSKYTKHHGGWDADRHTS
jgi:hypothetical protein